MADIPGLDEDFASVTNGGTLTTSNTKYDSFTGAGTSVGDTTNKYAALNSALFTVASASRNARLDFTAGQLDAGWFGFAFQYVAAFDVNCGIWGLYGTGNTVHAGDLRINTDGTLRLRDSTSVEVGSWNYSMTANQWYYVTVRPTPNNWAIKVYNNGSLVSSKLTGLTTNFAVTNTDTIRMGPQTTSTGSIRFARLRGDTATEPTTGIVGGSPSITYAETKATRRDFAGSVGTITVTQTSGPTAAAILTSGGVVTVVYPTPFTTDMVFNINCDDNGTQINQSWTVSPPGSGKKTTFVYNSTSGLWT